MAQILMANDSLFKLKFQEDPNSKWSDASKAEFINFLKSSKCIMKVKFEPHDKKDETQGHHLFKKEA